MDVICGPGDTKVCKDLIIAEDAGGAGFCFCCCGWGRAWVFNFSPADQIFSQIAVSSKSGNTPDDVAAGTLEVDF